MRNPFRSEAEAYRFLLVGVAYVAAIVAAKLLAGTWASLGVAVVGGLAFAYWIVATGPREPPPRIEPAAPHEGEWRILVVANETVGGEALQQRIRERAADVREEVLVVCPALNSPLRHWASDEDTARREAQARLERSLAQLAEAGVRARGHVGDADPLQAMEDACRTFGPDEIIISTHPEGRSHWLERGVVDAARDRFSTPITHVVVDLAAEAADVRGDGA